MLPLSLSLSFSGPLLRSLHPERIKDLFFWLYSVCVLLCCIYLKFNGKEKTTEDEVKNSGFFWNVYQILFRISFNVCDRFFIGKKSLAEKSYRGIAFSTFPFEFYAEISTLPIPRVIFHPPHAHLCGYLAAHFIIVLPHRRTYFRDIFTRDQHLRPLVFYVERRKNLSRTTVFFDNSRTINVFAVMPLVPSDSPYK